jgi:hypothetical protein
MPINRNKYRKELRSMHTPKTDDCSTGNDSLIEHYLAEIRKRLPVVDKTLELYGELPLSEYLDVVTKTPSERYQSHEDLADAVYEYAAPLLGEEVAAMAREELKQSPVVMTANHHGVDYFAQSVQGTLLFSQRKLPDGQKAKTVPVLACGNIPMNNLTYPRGMLCYDVTQFKQAGIPIRLPIFPKRRQNDAVSLAAPFDKKALERAEKSTREMVDDNLISTATGKALKSVLEYEYSSPRVLDLSSYSDQAVVINSLLWKRLFHDDGASKLLYLEQEEIVRKLLIRDLASPTSMVSLLMLDAEFLKILLTELDGAQGCWQSEELENRIQAVDSLSTNPTNPTKSTGSFLFWWIDDAGRRIPLALDKCSDQPYLRGISQSGVRCQVELTENSLIDGLETKRLMPSTFTCFLALAFARGVTCVGGYYQADYLPVIQQGLVRSIEEHGRHKSLIPYIKGIPTDKYLSGMQTVMCEWDDGALHPAGQLEMIASGVSVNDHISTIVEMTVQDAHKASLVETAADAAPDKVRSEDWNTGLADQLGCYFAGKVVTI